MKKTFLTAVTAAALFATSFSVSAWADTLDDVVDRGTLRCGVVLDFPPIGYRDATTSQQGSTWNTALTWLLRWKSSMKSCR